MEFRIAKDELIRALSRVQGIVEKRSTNPIIANVLLEAGSDGMKVSATDTEISLIGHYAIECIQPGRLTLGAKQLYEIARLVPTDTVSFCLSEGTFIMEINSGKAQFKVLGLSADDFPPITDGGDGDGLELAAADLKGLVDKTLFSISSDDTRTGLNGAHVEVVELPGGRSHVRFVSTDGHRLSLAGRPYEGTWTPTRSVLLPKKGLAELRKLVDVGDGPWRVVLGDTQAVFQRGTTAFSMRLLEGDFPDYKQVIPGGWQRRILVQRAHLMQALRRVSILASEKSHPVRFHIKDGTLIVTAKQPEAGGAREEIDAQVEGQDLEIGFNARYFLDSLNVMDTDSIGIEIGDSLSPCLVRPGEGEADELFVVMPMRLE